MTWSHNRIMKNFTMASGIIFWIISLVNITKELLITLPVYWNHIIPGSLNKFPDFFHMGTFIDSTHMKH